MGTISKYKLPVKILNLNNEILGMIRQWQEFYYEGRYMGAYLDNPNFATVAESFGLRGITAHTRDEMKDAISEADAFDGPVVLDIHVDQVENVYPMITPGTGIKSMIEDPR